MITVSWLMDLKMIAMAIKNTAEVLCIREKACNAINE